MSPLSRLSSEKQFDPAPSRLKYRLERLMLTPFFRFSLRVILPIGLLVGGGMLWFSVDRNREAFHLMLSDLRAAVESRPEFRVKLMAIDGASADVSELIRAELPIDFPISSFDLDLEAMQEQVVALGPVRKARLRIRQGGVLQVDVTERLPAILWRTEQDLRLLDHKGVAVSSASARDVFAHLPVIAGEGAERAVPEALSLYAVTGPLRGRLRGFERMGARRWDVVLDRGQRIMLPEEGAVLALERVIAMDQAIDIDLLSRDLEAVDLRLPQRPTIRMSDEATLKMWEIKAKEAGGE